MSLPRPLAPKGPILAYLDALRSAGMKREADDVTRRLQAILGGEDGAFLMEVLDTVTFMTAHHHSESVGALAARSAQALIASDLRRLLTDETHRLLAEGRTASTGPLGRRRTG